MLPKLNILYNLYYNNVPTKDKVDETVDDTDFSYINLNFSRNIQIVKIIILI